jgi:hypothetical protein
MRQNFTYENPNVYQITGPVRSDRGKTIEGATAFQNVFPVGIDDFLRSVFIADKLRRKTAAAEHSFHFFR